MMMMMKHCTALLWLAMAMAPVQGQLLPQKMSAAIPQVMDAAQVPMAVGAPAPTVGCSDDEVLDGSCDDACTCPCGNGLGVWIDPVPDADLENCDSPPPESVCMEPVLAYELVSLGTGTCVVDCPVEDVECDEDSSDDDSSDDDSSDDDSEDSPDDSPVDSSDSTSVDSPDDSPVDSSDSTSVDSPDDSPVDSSDSTSVDSPDGSSSVDSPDDKPGKPNKRGNKKNKKKKMNKKKMHMRKRNKNKKKMNKRRNKKNKKKQAKKPKSGHSNSSSDDNKSPEPKTPDVVCTLDHDLAQSHKEVMVEVKSNKYSPADSQGLFDLTLKDYPYAPKGESVTVPAWCIDFGRKIWSGTFSMDVFSAFDKDIHTNAVDKPQHFPNLAWLINNINVGDYYPGTDSCAGREITMLDLQGAIWKVIDDADGSGTWYGDNREDECVSDGIAAKALAEGQNYELDCSDLNKQVPVIFIVDKGDNGKIMNQVLMAEMKLSQIEGMCQCGPTDKSGGGSDSGSNSDSDDSSDDSPKHGSKKSSSDDSKDKSPKSKPSSVKDKSKSASSDDGMKKSKKNGKPQKKRKSPKSKKDKSPKPRGRKDSSDSSDDSPKSKDKSGKNKSPKPKTQPDDDVICTLDHDVAQSTQELTVDVKSNKYSLTDSQSMFDLTLTDAPFAPQGESVTVPAWCIDFGRKIWPGTFSMDVFSAFDKDMHTDAVDKPQHFPNLAWLINNVNVGDYYPSCGRSITLLDLQGAIWKVIDDADGTGTWYGDHRADECVSDGIAAQALEEGQNYELDCSDLNKQVPVIFIVDKGDNGEILNQVLMAEMKLSQIEGMCQCDGATPRTVAQPIDNKSSKSKSGKSKSSSGSDSSDDGNGSKSGKPYKKRYGGNKKRYGGNKKNKKGSSSSDSKKSKGGNLRNGKKNNKNGKDSEDCD